MLYVTASVALALFGWFIWEKRHRPTRAMAGGLHEDINLPYGQEYELYHNDLSLCSKKVRVCLSELGVPYKAHHIDLIETGSYETISRHYLRINPAGILPVLVHNGHPVYESHDIISYVAAHSPNPERQLVPNDPQERELMQHWKDIASIIGDDPAADLQGSAAACVSVLTVPLFAAGIAVIPYHRILEGLLFHRIRSRPILFLTLKAVGLPNLLGIGKVKIKLREAKAALCVHLLALDQLLEDGRLWITGEQFTLADISWMVLFDRMLEADWYELFLGGNEYPQVKGYWERLRDRRSYHEGVDRFRHPLVTQATLEIQKRKTLDPRFNERMAEGCPTSTH